LSNPQSLLFNLNAYSIQVNKAIMEKKHTVLQTLFPKARAEIFRLLFGRGKRPRYVREIMRESDLALRTVQDELKRLSAVGLVSSHSNGYHRFFAPNSAHPLCREVTRIAEMSEQLPHARSSELFRASRTRRRKKRFKAGAMRPDRQPNWGIFSNRRRKT